MSTRGTDPTGRYTCSYCAESDGKSEPARFTVHDARGCLHVCWKHAEWRQTTSMAGGHSRDCPHREMEPLVAEAHKAVAEAEPHVMTMLEQDVIDAVRAGIGDGRPGVDWFNLQEDRWRLTNALKALDDADLLVVEAHKAVAQARSLTGIRAQVRQTAEAWIRFDVTQDKGDGPLTIIGRMVLALLDELETAEALVVRLGAKP